MVKSRSHEMLPAGSTTVVQVMAEIGKRQQLDGHFPDAQAFARARKVLVGKTTAEDAVAEVRAKYLGEAAAGRRSSTHSLNSRAHG